MTICEFVAKYKEKNPEGHYFDSDTLKFFGERLSEMRVLKDVFEKTDICGKKHKVYCVSSIRRSDFSKPHRHYAYFDVETLISICL